MSEIGSTINALVEELKNAQCRADLQSSLEDWTEATGFDWYLFALNRSESMQESEQIIISNYPEDWRAEYISERYMLIDPVVKHVLNHQNNVFWNTFSDLEGYNSPEQTEFMKKAATHGLVSGCSIPCNSYGNFAVLSIADRSESKVSEMNDYLPYNHFYANQLLESALKLNIFGDGDVDKDQISERETECLFWGSEGKTAWEISKILGISERTVVFHFKNAATKLNATSRQHAISKALLHGVVRPSL